MAAEETGFFQSVANAICRMVISATQGESAAEQFEREMLQKSVEIQGSATRVETGGRGDAIEIRSAAPTDDQSHVVKEERMDIENSDDISKVRMNEARLLKLKRTAENDVYMYEQKLARVLENIRRLKIIIERKNLNLLLIKNLNLRTVILVLEKF